MKIGIDLGGSHIGIGVVNEKGKIIDKQEIDLNYEQNSNMSEFIIEYILETINIFSNQYSIEAIGIASPGTPKDGKITSLVNLGIEELNITEIIKQYYQIPISVKNDAKCAAIAEKQYGSLKEYQDCVFLCVGTGIGGGVFINGNMLIPSRNPGMEIGHMIIQKDGNLCNCGKKGCFETYCSMKRLKNKLIKIMNLDENTESKQLLEILRQRKYEEEIKEVLNEYIEDFIVGLSNVIDIFEPQAICLGGGFAYFRDILYDLLIERYYQEKYVFNESDTPVIKLSMLGNDAGIIGAAVSA